MRCSPVIAPPSVVATISFFTSASFASTVASFACKGSESRRPHAPAPRGHRGRLRCDRRACSCRRTRRLPSRIASKCALRSAALYGARRSRPIATFVSITSLPRVRRSVYVPGTTRGPCDDAERDLRRTRHPRRLHAHVPHHAVDAAVLARRDRVDELAGRVEDLELERADRCDACAGSTSRSAPFGGLSPTNDASPSTQPPDAGIRSWTGRAGRNAVAFWTSVMRQRAQRRQVVDDPDAAAVRRDHEVAVARLDLDLAHRDAAGSRCPRTAPTSRRRRPRSRARIRCRGTGGSA